MVKICLSIVLLLIYVPAWGVTYYVDAAGGNDSNYGTVSNNAWKTISKVKTSTFSAGDSILFKRGETWREQLTVPSSGSAVNVITFGAYGSGANPIISGADIVTNWVADSAIANVYNAIVAAQPNQVFKDGTRIVLGTSKTALNDHEWFASGKTLYYRDDSGTPRSAAYTISASVRDSCINVNKDYLNFSGIYLGYGNNNNFNFSGAANTIDINNITSSYAANNGIHTYSDTEDQNVKVYNSTFSWNGAHGIYVVNGSHNWIISNNIINNNSQIAGTYGDQEYSAGIRLWNDDNTINNVFVQNNVVNNNGVLPDASRITGNRGLGIWFDSISGDNNAIRYNTSHSNTGDNLRLEQSSNQNMYYNLSYSSTGYGIRVDSYSYVSATSGNKIYNNVAYGNAWGGIVLQGTSTRRSNSCINNTVKNNISTGNERWSGLFGQFPAVYK